MITYLEKYIFKTLRTALPGVNVRNSQTHYQETYPYCIFYNMFHEGGVYFFFKSRMDDEVEVIAGPVIEKHPGRDAECRAAPHEVDLLIETDTGERG